jgi:DNA-binding GntR family transcriptional regulator
VREALALLVHEGLIASTSRGFRPPEMSREDLADLYQIRRMLEPAALATTLDRLSAHDFRMLRQFLGEQEAADARDDAAAFVEANSNFRASMARCGSQQATACADRAARRSRPVGAPRDAGGYEGA